MPHKHTPDRLYIEADSQPNGPNYKLVDGDSAEVLARVEWLSFQPCGTPFSLGGSIEFGGDSHKTVKYANRSEEKDGVVYAAGARVHLQQNV